MCVAVVELSRCYCFLIPIASRGRPVFRVVSCHDPPVSEETKDLQNLSQSPSAPTRVPTTLAFFNGVSKVEPECFAPSHKALFHMNQRVGLWRRLFSPKVKKLPAGSPKLEILHQANGKSPLPSEREFSACNPEAVASLPTTAPARHPNACSLPEHYLECAASVRT